MIEPTGTQDGICTMQMPEWTWRERLQAKVFPKKYCDLPEAPPQWKDVLTMNTHVHLSFADRVRLLFTGHLVVSSKTVCQNEIGLSKTSSVAYPEL